MIAAFSALTTDYTDERGFGERLYVISNFTHFLIYQAFGLFVRHILYPKTAKKQAKSFLDPRLP